MNKVFKIALLVLFLYSITGMQLYAQQNHFVYIQSDDKVPFEVSVNGMTYNSSSIGYVIVPKLTKGNHQLNVSFQNKKFPDQQFSCMIDKMDAGFLLKNYTDKGWGLFNLQSLDIIMAGTGALPVAQEVSKPAETNAFGDMLSEVVNDSALVSKTEPVKQEQQTVSVISDTSAILKEEIVGEQKTNALIQNDKKDFISHSVLVIHAVEVPVVSGNDGATNLIKLNESTTIAGTDLVFVDKSSGLNDTIRIFLPTQPADMAEGIEKRGAASIIDSVKTDSALNAATDVVTKKEEVAIVNAQSSEVKNPFFAGDNQQTASQEVVKNNLAIADKNTAANQVKELPVIARPECNHILSENDMNKFRKKMVSTGSDQKMIDIVRKGIQDKCITTDQVKNLGALFLSDDGRYSFFNAVYPLVADVSAFSSLESQLIDPNYKKRFRDLLK